MDRCGPSSVLDSKRDVADSDTGYEVFDTPCDHGELQAVLTLDLHTAEKTRAKYQLRHNDVSTFNSNRERHSLALTTEAPGIIDRAAAVLSFPLSTCASHSSHVALLTYQQLTATWE